MPPWTPGATGPAGPEGPAGPTGPTGPAGASSTSAGYFNIKAATSAPGTYPSTATIDGSCSALTLISNTGRNVVFHATQNCNVIIGGSSFAQGTDDASTGGGHCYYIQTVSAGAGQSYSTKIWLSNVGSGDTVAAAINLNQTVLNSSGTPVGGNQVFPQIIIPLTTGESLTINWDDANTQYRWDTTQVQWAWAISVGAL